ncbi:protein of unknown function DUF324 [Ammonifex degensii KC4]|uniref:CRISPR type III-associated protein domain-containing protein n=1 Tax=Ammonifex degensii (strain DSM 10501 / KC4) TaxID=429009 RepID=C9RCY9_AMMDK|nr:RAMP superfamily CRISPR-associated protein [Ammonifex degensii]ACX52116.1 protein of unknown function DUF324 [Ammonifex degensii KC4]
MGKLWLLKLEIEFEGMLHIGGTGSPQLLVDRTVVLDKEGWPYLPASTVRGRLRACLERLLKTLNQPVCSPPYPEFMCPQGYPEENYCPACRLFGSPWRQGALYFRDFVLDPKPGEAEIAELRLIRTGIGIDRRRNTVEEERLFFTEVVSPSAGEKELRFVGEVELREDAPELLGWLLASLRLVTHVGGQKSRGLGRARIEVSEIKSWDPERGWVAVSDVKRFAEEVIEHALSGAALL